nr:hypothetical protein [Tanacetum cinerariifolium]
MILTCKGFKRDVPCEGILGDLNKTMKDKRSFMKAYRVTYIEPCIGLCSEFDGLFLDYSRQCATFDTMSKLFHETLVTWQERMMNARHKEVLKDSTSKGAEPSASDADHDDRHKSNECPNPKAIKVKPLKSIKEEKVMAAKKDKLVHDVVTGTILVNSIPTSVWYESGVSVSSVSYEFIKNLSTIPNKLPFPLEVKIADSKVVVVSNVYRDVEIEIGDSTFRIELIPIMLGVFDIVINTDWLDKYNVIILPNHHEPLITYDQWDWL